MKIDSKNIPFSRNDIKRKIKIPKRLEEDLSELIGIIMGDGNIYMKNNRYELQITGDMNEDSGYHKEHINSLIKKAFNLKPKIIEKGNFRRLVLKSKAIVSFLVNTLKLCNGKKNLKIPDYIFNSNHKIKRKFLRGLADTDFTIKFKTRYGNKNYYPIVIGNFNSEEFSRELKLLLESIGFHSHIEKRRKYDKIRNKIYLSYAINIVGKKNFKKWMESIGFSNKKHLIRYKVWSKLGYCPPYTNISKGRILLKK